MYYVSQGNKFVCFSVNKWRQKYLKGFWIAYVAAEQAERLRWTAFYKAKDIQLSYDLPIVECEHPTNT